MLSAADPCLQTMTQSVSSKAFPAICLTVGGIVIRCSWGHWQNAYIPIVVTLSGITISFKEEYAKQPSQSSWMWLGIVNESILESDNSNQEYTLIHREEFLLCLILLQ